MKKLTLTDFRQYLIYGILLTLPLERVPSLSVGPDDTTVRLSQLLGLILIVLSAKPLWRSRAKLVRAPWLFLVAFNLVVVVSAGLSAYPRESLMTAGFIGFVSVLSYTIAQLFDPTKLRSYLTYGLTGVVLTCLFGIYQYFGDLADLPGWLTGLSQSYMKGGIFPFPRIQSTALEPLYFANYLLVPLALLVTAQLFTKRRVWPLTLLVTTVILLSLSRGAQAAAVVVVSILIAAAVVQKHYRAAAQAVATLAASVVVALACVGLGSFLYGDIYGVDKKPSVTKNIEEFTDQATNVSQGESAEGRALTRKLALQAALQNPVLGLGAGTFGHYANLVEPGEFPTTDTIVNNETLEIAAEQGITGLALILVFAGWLVWSGIQFIRGSADRTLRLTALGLLVGLFGIALQYQLFSTLYITHIWVYIGLLAGITLGTRKRVRYE